MFGTRKVLEELIEMVEELDTRISKNEISIKATDLAVGAAFKQLSKDIFERLDALEAEYARKHTKKTTTKKATKKTKGK